MDLQIALKKVIDAAKAQLEDIKSGIEDNLYDAKENDVTGLETAIAMIERGAGSSAVNPAIVLVTVKDGILSTAHDGQLAIEVVNFDAARSKAEPPLLPEAYRDLVFDAFGDPYYYGIRYQGENTKLELVYCDASSCQVRECVVVGGAISERQIALIAEKLQGGQFIAHQVGLPTPSLQQRGNGGWPSEIDHVFTSLEAFENGTPSLGAAMLTVDEPTHDISIDELVERFTAVSSWDERGEWDRLKALA